MLTYRKLYNDTTWNIKEVRKLIDDSEKTMIVVGSYLSDNILSENDPSKWGLKIALFCELYSTIYQTIFNIEDILESSRLKHFGDKKELTDDMTIKVDKSLTLILKAFSENIELAQNELYSEFNIKIFTDISMFN